MSSFAAKNYLSKNYNSFRPHYPQHFYKSILLKYHQGQKDKLLDIGCGTGVASFSLLDSFNKIIGLDASPKMIETAKSIAQSRDESRIEFQVSTAESFPMIESGSIDMITAAQCIHWFNPDKFFEECNRVLKPGGTLAYWFYIDPVIDNQKIANDIVNKYVYEDPRYMGPKWEQPGRNILRGFLQEIEPPSKYFQREVRNIYKVNSSDIERGNCSNDSLLISRKCSLAEFGDYFKTASAYYNWKVDNPDKPDVADLMLAEIKSTLGWEDYTEVDLIWNTGYVFVEKK